MWNHLAAILFFGGPLFYIGLIMTVDPEGVAAIPAALLRALRSVARSTGGPPPLSDAERESDRIRRDLRRVVRIAGVALLLFAIAA